MAKAGQISLVLYWYQGLSGWVQLGASPPKVPLNTEFNLAVGWVNMGDEDLHGHIALTVTRPDGVKIEPSALANQDKVGSPGNGWIVQFAPIVLEQSGTYNASASVMETGGTVVLDEVSFPIALASFSVIDIFKSMMPPMMMLMMMGMVMPMMWRE